MENTQIKETMTEEHVTKGTVTITEGTVTMTEGSVTKGTGTMTEGIGSAAQTRFGLLFMDLLANLQSLFPTCENIQRLHGHISQDPFLLNTIKLDWGRIIQPYNIKNYKHVNDYFQEIERDVSTQHVFRQLKLYEKYKSFETVDEKNVLCTYLSELEKYSLDDTIEQTNDQKHEPNNRFDDAELIQMCRSKLGDPKLVEQLLEQTYKSPELSDWFRQSTNQEISEFLPKIKPLIPGFVQLMQTGFPLEQLVQTAASFTGDRMPQKKKLKKSKTK